MGGGGVTQQTIIIVGGGVDKRKKRRKSNQEELVNLLDRITAPQVDPDSGTFHRLSKGGESPTVAALFEEDDEEAILALTRF